MAIFSCLPVDWLITEGAFNWGAGGGLKAVVYGSLFQTFRYWGMHKEKKNYPAFFNTLILTIWRPTIGYHKLYSCTFLSRTVKCRVMYTLYRLYGLEDPIEKTTLSITQPKSIFLGSCSHHALRVGCKAWFEIGNRILDQTWNRVGKITYSPLSLIWTFKGNRKKVRVIGSSNYRGQNHIENDLKGNENWFKLAGGSSFREFELPELIFWR